MPTRQSILPNNLQVPIKILIDGKEIEPKVFGNVFKDLILPRKPARAPTSVQSFATSTGFGYCLLKLEVWCPGFTAIYVGGYISECCEGEIQMLSAHPI